MEIPNLIRWEEKKKDVLGYPYYVGWSGKIRLCSVYRQAEGKGFFLEPEAFPQPESEDSYIFKGRHTMRAETANELMVRANFTWFKWLQKAGIVPFTESLANEVIARIEQTAFEEGGNKEDENLRAWIEGLFPAIRGHREDKEYGDWLWAIKVEADPRVKKARAATERNDPSGDPVPRWDSIDEMMAVKRTVLHELLAMDQETLKAEWRKEKGHADG
jgi:hypothetical protein